MPFPLSYPGLLCVLEHLEAVKRAHIIGRSPGHQKIDKLIPLCLENLHIGKSELVINKLWITCEKDEVNLKMKRKTFSRQISESQEDKMKKLAHFWISGRSKIYVDRLRWFCSLPPGFLPVDLKFRVNSLNAFCDLGAAIPYIDPRSFPLKTVATTLKSSTLFDNQVVKFAETLILNLIHHRNVTVEDLKKLENKTVMIKSFWDFIIDIILLIEYHIETQKDIRTTFVISTGDRNVLSRKLREFDLVFGEFQSNLDDVNERFIPGLPKFSIPINNETRIRVYAIDDSEEDCPYKKYFPYKIIVKPVSIVSGL